jgi:putative peptidoglycan lipid II flippase
MNLRTRQLFTTPVFAGIGRLSGVLIPFVIAFFYGVSQETDSFFLSFTIVFFVLGIFQQVFESVLLPYLIEKKADGCENIQQAVFIVLFKIILALSFILSFVFYFLPDFLSRFSGLQNEVAIQTQVVSFTMLPFLLLSIAVSAFNGILNTYKHFAWSAISPFIRSCSVVVIIFFFYKKMGIFAIPFGFALGEILRLILTMGYLSKLKSNIEAKDSTSRVLSQKFWSQALLQIAALSCVQFIPLLNQWFATWLNEGDITVLGYAERLYIIPFQIFLAGLSQVYLSDWSERYFSLSPAEFKKNVYRDAMSVTCISFVISIILYLFRYWIIKLTYGLGDQVQESMLKEIADVFGWFIIGFSPAVLTSLLLRVFFVMKRTGYFLSHSIFRIVLQLGLNFYFVSFFGIQGIAIAVTVGSLLGAVSAVLMLQPLWKVKKNG